MGLVPLLPSSTPAKTPFLGKAAVFVKQPDGPGILFIDSGSEDHDWLVGAWVYDAGMSVDGSELPLDANAMGTIDAAFRVGDRQSKRWMVRLTGVRTGNLTPLTPEFALLLVHSDPASFRDLQVERAGFIPPLKEHNQAQISADSSD